VVDDNGCHEGVQGTAAHLPRHGLGGCAAHCLPRLGGACQSGGSGRCAAAGLTHHCPRRPCNASARHGRARSRAMYGGSVTSGNAAESQAGAGGMGGWQGRPAPRLTPLPGSASCRPSTAVAPPQLCSGWPAAAAPARLPALPTTPAPPQPPARARPGKLPPASAPALQGRTRDQMQVQGGQGLAQLCCIDALMAHTAAPPQKAAHLLHSAQRTCQRAPGLPPSRPQRLHRHACRGPHTLQHRLQGGPGDLRTHEGIHPRDGRQGGDCQCNRGRSLQTCQQLSVL
jgi:hypothetical protein